MSWERHEVAHALRHWRLIPRWLLDRLCDRYDAKLGHPSYTVDPPSLTWPVPDGAGPVDD